MVGDEFQQQGFRRRPGEGSACGRQRPGQQIGEVGCQRPQRILAHARIDKMAEDFDILIGEQLGQFIAAPDRQPQRWYRVLLRVFRSNLATRCSCRPSVLVTEVVVV